MSSNVSDNNQFSRVADTSISGQALLAALSGDDIQALNYQAAVNNYVLDVSTAATSVAGPGAWMQQAAISQLPVLLPAAAAASSYIDLGSDTGANASRYLQLLNITSSNQRRILNFTALNCSGFINLQCAGASTTRVQVFNGANTQIASAPIIGTATTAAPTGNGKIIVTGSPSSVLADNVVSFRCVPNDL